MTAAETSPVRPAPDVVLVDDDPIMVRATKVALQSLLSGVQIRTFVDPHRAFTAIVAAPPAVVITDHEMPRCTGLELAAALRRALGPDCPRLALVTGADISRAGLRTVDAYLAKPFQLARLVSIVEPWLLTKSSGVRALSVHERPTEPPPKS